MSTKLLERFNQEVKRRTLMVRFFPDEASCLRLVRAVAAERHEEWKAAAISKPTCYVSSRRSRPNRLGRRRSELEVRRTAPPRFSSPWTP